MLASRLCCLYSPSDPLVAYRAIVSCGVQLGEVGSKPQPVNHGSGFQQGKVLPHLFLTDV